MRLSAAARAARAAIGVPLAPIERSAGDDMMAALRTSMGEERFVRAWAEGGSLTLDEALAAPLRVDIEANGEPVEDSGALTWPTSCE